LGADYDIHVLGPSVTNFVWYVAIPISVEFRFGTSEGLDRRENRSGAAVSG